MRPNGRFWLGVGLWCALVASFLPADPGVYVGICGVLAALWIRARTEATAWRDAATAWENVHHGWRELAKEYEEEADRWRDATHLWQSIALMELRPAKLTGTPQ